MILPGTIGKVVRDPLSVVNFNKSPVPGLIDSDFSRQLYNPNDLEVSSSINIVITEMGGGHYVTRFTPDLIGLWYLVVYHPKYFPQGKASSIHIGPDILDLETRIDEVHRYLGLDPTTPRLVTTTEVTAGPDIITTISHPTTSSTKVTRET
jgi:hypothetical protein